MALSFPLSPAQWMNILAVREVTFHASPQVEVSQTAGGEYLPRRIAPTLWRGSVTLHDLPYGCGAGREAMLGKLQEPGASFLVYHKRRSAPKDDPEGTLISGSSPTLAAVAGNGDVTINGLPGNYWLREGDFFAFTYGTNPVRYALHQVVGDRRASAGGSVNGLVVHPAIRVGWTAGAAVTFIKPVCKAIMVPGSVSEGLYGPVAISGLSFRWQQTLR